MTTTIHPTKQALRLHRSHLATTHRAPLVPGRPSAARTHATSFTPMASAPLMDETLTDETPSHRSQNPEH